MAPIETITKSADGKTFTAATFLEYMRKSAAHWWDDEQDATQCPWVFRGHWDANFKLLPTAARPDFAGADEFGKLVEKITTELENCEKWRKLSPNQRGQISRFFAHYRSIEKFVKIARELDFIPDKRLNHSHIFCEILRHYGGKIPIENIGQITSYLAKEVFGQRKGISFLYSDIMALAQHHGIATYLLDWTENPITACYFASTKPSSETPKELAVWALNLSTFNYKYDEKEYYLGLKDIERLPAIHIIRPASANNKYLSSQAGVLTFALDFIGVLDKEQMFPDLETLIDSYDRDLIMHEYEAHATRIKRSGNQNEVNNFNLNDENGRRRIDDWFPEGHTYLRKVILPASELSEYRKLLLREGISKAHLMPTLDNVATTAKASLLDED